MQNVLSAKWVKGLLIGFFSFSFFAIVSQSRFLGLLELKILDFKFFLRGFRSADSKVFLIGIDDPSLRIIGRWPWPRFNHAALLEQLSRKPPTALGFDILFHEPEEANPNSDRALVQMSH